MGWVSLEVLRRRQWLGAARETTTPFQRTRQSSGTTAPCVAQLDRAPVPHSVVIRGHARHSSDETPLASRKNGNDEFLPHTYAPRRGKNWSAFVAVSRNRFLDCAHRRRCGPRCNIDSMEMCFMRTGFPRQQRDRSAPKNPHQCSESLLVRDFHPGDLFDPKPVQSIAVAFRSVPTPPSALAV